jgi:5-methylcytosine-specific restriction endonuclease McrA
MDSITKHLDVSYWVNDFYERIFNAYESKKKHLVNNDLRFFCEIANRFNSITTCGGALTNFTQMLQMDSNWDPTYYASNKLFQTNGIINWFASSSESTYQGFTIIKSLLNPKKLKFISKDEYDIMFKLTGSTQFAYCVFAFQINKVLLEIYKNWANPDAKMDHNIVSNKYDEILNRYSVQSNLCNKPNLNCIYDKSVFAPTNLYKVLLFSQVGSDNYDCFLEIFNYLKSYHNIIAEYKVEPHNQFEQSKSDNTTKTTITTKLAKSKAVKTDYSEPSDSEEFKKTKSTKHNTKKADSDLVEGDVKKSTKTKKKPIPPNLKRNVWNKYIGEDIGKAKCTCCRLVDITQLSFHCGHIIAEAKGGELKMDNLKPICQSCNSSMSTMNMNEYIEKYGF